MNRRLAGAYDPSGNGHGDARAVAQALTDPAGVHVARGGPLALAFTGSEDPVHGGELLCLLDGRVSNLETLARSLDVHGRSPEAILATAYGRFGEGMVAGLHGEFALLVWDQAARRGLLARDRLGARPLFLWRSGGRLRFASEIRDLLRLLPRRPGPDRTAVVHWLSGTTPRSGRTMYEGVAALNPGHYLVLGGGDLEQRRYWQPAYAGTLELARDDAVHHLRREIAGAVERSLAQGAAAGVLLSGGLDSATVAGAATSVLNPPRSAPSAYSAVFPWHPSADESPLIDRVTGQLGLRSVRLAVLGGSMVAGALEYVDLWQLPLTDQNNVFMQPLLRRATEDGVQLMLDGEGGDELFGAARGLIADRLRAGRPLAAVRLTARLPGAGDRPPWRPLMRLFAVHGVRGALPLRVHRAARRARGRERGAPSWLTPASARLLFETDESSAWKRLHGPRWWAQLADSLTAGIAARGVHDHARRRAEMAGLHARHPFLDAALIDFMLRLPPELSFDPHLSRPLLRASGAGIVPDEVRLRPRKTYFDAPFYEAMAGHDLAHVRRVVLDPDAEVGAFVDLEAVRRQLLDVAPARHPLGTRFWTASAWRLVSAECWLRSQRDPGFARRALETWDLHARRYRLTEASPR